MIQDTLLLGEIHGYERQRQVVERIRAKLSAAADLFKLSTVHLIQPEAEALGHFQLPLLKQRTSRANDENAVGHPASDELSDNKPRLHCLAQSDSIGKEHTRPAQPDGAKDWHKLVGLDAKAARLDRKKCTRS
jgi:hypothetical protein